MEARVEAAKAANEERDGIAKATKALADAKEAAAKAARTLLEAQGQELTELRRLYAAQNYVVKSRFEAAAAKAAVTKAVDAYWTAVGNEAAWLKGKADRIAE